MTKFKISNSQRGVSLIITFFITIIILFVVLAISTILYSEIRIIRNIGNSVVAFYAADSGVEETFYYDRKEIPAGAGRGICNICASGVCPDCYDCSATGLDCETCSDCHVAFSSRINPNPNLNKFFDADIIVSQQCRVSTGVVSSYGFYKNVSRAIQIDYRTEVSNLSIPDSGATATAQGPTGVNMVISATVLDPEGVGIASVVAAITGFGAENYNQCDPAPSLPFIECTYREITLTSGGGGNYSHPWNYGLQDVTYNINIMATDNNGNCIEVKNITITYE